MTQNYRPIMEAVLARVKESYVNSVIGFIPPNGGVALSYAGGTIKTDMVGNSYGDMRINVSAKSGTQNECAEMIDAACSAIQRMKAESEGWQISGGSLVTAPQLAAQESSGNWIMTAAATVHCVSFTEG